MKKDKNLKKRILEEAKKLFQKQGIKATTIKQIAEASNCTNAALYYYFENGKNEIIKETIFDILKDRLTILEGLEDSKDLNDFITKLGKKLNTEKYHISNNISWLIVEFNQIPDEIEKVFHDNFDNFHKKLSSIINIYIDNKEKSEDVAWILFCSVFGYQQLFQKMNFSKYFKMDLNEFTEKLATTIS